MLPPYLCFLFAAVNGLGCWVSVLKHETGYVAFLGASAVMLTAAGILKLKGKWPT